MHNKWPYNHKRAEEFVSSENPATIKQIRYIDFLSANRDDGILTEILLSIEEKKTVSDLTLGQAMFVIKCLNGEILPYQVPDEEDEIKQIWQAG